MKLRDRVKDLEESLQSAKNRILELEAFLTAHEQIRLQDKATMFRAVNQLVIVNQALEFYADPMNNLASDDGKVARAAILKCGVQT
jgi:hypothetical protein